MPQVGDFINKIDNIKLHAINSVQWKVKCQLCGWSNKETKEDTDWYVVKPTTVYFVLLSYVWFLEEAKKEEKKENPRKRKRDNTAAVDLRPIPELN